MYLNVNVEHALLQEVLHSLISSYNLHHRFGCLLYSIYCLARVAIAICLEIDLELVVIAMDARSMPDVKPHCLDTLSDFEG